MGTGVDGLVALMGKCWVPGSMEQEVDISLHGLAEFFCRSSLTFWEWQPFG